jgi:hypothetical protein
VAGSCDQGNVPSGSIEGKVITLSGECPSASEKIYSMELIIL